MIKRAVLVGAVFAGTVLSGGVLIAAAAPARAEGSSPAPESGMNGPGAGSTPRALLDAPPPKSYLTLLDPAPAGGGSAIFSGLLGFYRTVISPVDGDRCDMAPTCSLYSHQAIQSHGVIVGILLTADRLLHEADERPMVRPLRIAGEKFYPDPLLHNTYWLPGWLR